MLFAALTAVFPLTDVLGPALGVISAPLQAAVNAISGRGPIGTVLANPRRNVVNLLNVPNHPIGQLPDRSRTACWAKPTDACSYGVMVGGMPSTTKCGREERNW